MPLSFLLLNKQTSKRREGFKYKPDMKIVIIEQGVYEFKKLTLLGFNSGEEEIQKLKELKFKVRKINR